MCYSTKITKKASEIEIRFDAVFEDLSLFSANKEISAFTYPKTPIITHEKNHIIEHCNWGLIPNWAKDESIKKYTLNARIETITQKPSFKDNLNNRCLIIANGFYEWQWLNEKGSLKQKYEIGMDDQMLFSFAGLWSSWLDKDTNAHKKTYTIVTTEAQGIMKQIHNSKKRMPVILTKENENDWLSGSLVDDFKNVNVKLIANKILPNISDNLQLSIFD